MGLLCRGDACDWKETKRLSKTLKQNAIKQFITLYHKYNKQDTEEATDDPFLWGDEIEFTVIEFDHTNRQVKLLLCADKLLPTLWKSCNSIEQSVGYHPEYTKFQIESIPSRPYTNELSSLCRVEENMLTRRKTILKHLKENQSVVSISAFPMFGHGECTVPRCTNLDNNIYSKSKLVSDEMIYPHDRFQKITSNLIARRERKVSIRLGVYKDKNTKIKECFVDAPIYGSGLCCLQVTYQAPNVDACRHLYDQMGILSPLFMALSATTPAYNGLLLDKDTRWYILEQALDDRTARENDDSDPHHIPKSRWSSIDCYLNPDSCFNAKYNDLELPYDDDSYQQLLSNKVDKSLAKHVSHLSLREALLLYPDRISQDIETGDHWLNIQSSVWQSVRFKAPSGTGHVKWRVELRTMDLQFSAFENAAFSVFSSLLSLAIMEYNLLFYVPISKLDENFDKAQQIDAVLNERFTFRKDIHNRITGSALSSHFADMSLAEIFCGTKEKLHDENQVQFLGLVNVVRKYVKEHLQGPQLQLQTIEGYLRFIEDRARGKNPTGAHFVRNFIVNHNEYSKDSKVSQRMQYDLMVALNTRFEDKQRDES